MRMESFIPIVRPRHGTCLKVWHCDYRRLDPEVVLKGHLISSTLCPGCAINLYLQPLSCTEVSTTFLLLLFR